MHRFYGSIGATHNYHSLGDGDIVIFVCVHFDRFENVNVLF